MDAQVEDRGSNGKVETFTGLDGQSAVRRLRKFAREHVTRKDGTQVSTGIWLEEVDGHIGGVEEKWADQTPAVRNLLDEDKPYEQSEDDFATFKMLSLDHFKVETDAPLGNAVQ